jgi:hypothetical protein
MNIIEFCYEHQLLSGIVLLLLFAYAYHILLITPLPSEPPLLKGSVPFVGTLPSVLLNFPTFLRQAKSLHGDIFTLYVLTYRVTIITDPIQGVPSVFRKSKQLSFRAGLRRLYTHLLGFTPERCDEEELNREHFQMIPRYLLSTPAADELSGRYVSEFASLLRAEGTAEKEVDLFDWLARKVFMASGAAMWGENVFDGAENVVEDFRVVENGLSLRLMLPKWMTPWVANARDRLRNVFGGAFARGLKNPSSFTVKRIEVCPRGRASLDSTEVWV